MSTKGILHEYDRNRLIENNKRISTLLEENEEILRNAGFKIPIENFAFDAEREARLKIQIPKGYIRTKNYYMKEYGLYKICNNDEDRASNIAYSLEASDFYNYVFNRIGIYGPILAMMYKQATINIVSIIEMFMRTYVDTLRQKCKNCPQCNGCQARIAKKSHIKGHFQDQVGIYARENLLTGISSKTYLRICKLYEYRNGIHLSKSKENELTEDMHSQELYNEAIVYMKGINKVMKSDLDRYIEGSTCYRYLPKAR